MNMNAQTKQPFPLWALLLTIAGIIVLCSLGTWQLQRLAWKTELIEKLDQLYALDAASTILTDKDLQQARRGDEADMARGTISGIYHFDKDIRLIPFMKDGQPGAHMITPLALPDGSVLLVNRGWVPQDWVNPLAGQQIAVRLQGLVHQPDEPNAFTPENAPQDGQWFWLDFESIGAHFDLVRIHPLILRAETETLMSAQHLTGSYPQTLSERIQPNNNHAQYAAFWFCMAAALLIIFVIRFRLDLIKART